MNIAEQRLSSQRLVGPGCTNPTDVVRWLGAVQAQDYPGAKWGVALRMDGATSQTLDAAFHAGALLRTHVLRPTWHFVAPEDLRWLLALTAPRVHAANARIYRQFELDDVVMKRARALFTRALRNHNYLTRPELAALLEKNRIPAGGQRLAYIAMCCELDGLICSGPMRGSKPTYALVDERVPPTPEKLYEEALAELARRYFQSHGPATIHDFAWWSGLTVREARAATELLHGSLDSVPQDGKTYCLIAEAVTTTARRPTVHLLPNYDEHVVAYRDHGPSLDPLASDVLSGWGNASTPHLVARNGLVVGGWRRSLHRDHVAIELNIRAPLRPAERRELARAAAAYGRFLALPVVLDGVQV